METMGAISIFFLVPYGTHCYGTSDCQVAIAMMAPSSAWRCTSVSVDAFVCLRFVCFRACFAAALMVSCDERRIESDLTFLFL